MKCCPALLFLGSPDDKSIIEGFTIKNAYSGVNIYAGSSPIIINNIIDSCEIGIFCASGSQPNISFNIIKNCTNSDNYYEYGGGIRISDSSPIISNNLVINNSSSKGGGIYCKNSTPSIINNTIVGNSGIDASESSGDSNPILRCEYDNFNRIYECFVSLQNSSGGGIYIEDSSPNIINNIIAFSKESKNSSEPPELSTGLSRWYFTDLFMRYNYEGGKVSSVTYYYGFKNNGETGDVHLYSKQKGSNPIDTTFTIQHGERYWMETTSWVSFSGDYGGLNLTAHIGNDSIRVHVIIDNPMFAGCYFLLDTHIQSHGVAEGETGGAGITAIGDNSVTNISYNDVYGNGGGNYLVGETSDFVNLVDLAGVDGNISNAPLLDSLTFELSGGSPCIDAGTPDTTGLKIGETDFLGNLRFFDGDGNGIAVIDIGAVEYQSSSIETQEYVSICKGENYLGLTEEGEHTREFKTVNGCDSVVITHLTVNPTYETEEYVSICEGEEYRGYTEVGQHSIEIKTVNGCDSIVINLTIHPSFKLTFTNQSDTLTSDLEYANYQWYDSDGAIAGATNREFVISKSGEYYLEATNESDCTFLSDSKTINLTNITDYKTGEFTYTIMPNPNEGVFRFRIDSNPPEKFNIKLIDNLGQVMEVREIKNPVINQIERFDVSHLSKGIYHFVLTSDKYRATRKIVIQ